MGEINQAKQEHAQTVQADRNGKFLFADSCRIGAEKERNRRFFTFDIQELVIARRLK